MSGGSSERPLLLPWRGSSEACALAFTDRHPRWILRGERLRTKVDLMVEWATAVPFPAHFGATWDALRDALADLPAGGTFLVLEAHQLLQDAPPEEARNLIEVLREVGEDLAPRSFQLVLQAEEACYGTMIEGLERMGVDRRR
jgi:hypothetical protein